MPSEKLEIELNSEQLEKVEILKENGIDVGQAIDMLFEFKEFAYQDSNAYLDRKISQKSEEKRELEEKLEKVNEEMSLYEQLKESTLDLDDKFKAIEKDYGEAAPTYDVQVQNAKSKISWAKDFFKF